MSHPNFSLSWVSIQVTFGAVDIGLTVVSPQFVLFGGLVDKERVKSSNFSL